MRLFQIMNTLATNPKLYTTFYYQQIYQQN